MKAVLHYLLLAFMATGLVSCSQEPEMIEFGKDGCHFCKMTIMDERFGAEMITSKGKIYKFDSAECLVDYLKADQEAAKDPKSVILLVDYLHSRTFIAAEKASFLYDETIKSPMGGNLSVFASADAAQQHKASANGRVMNWDELQQIR
ncbi:MAG TPA: nitrous oxide reductase accessory protein NosL [Daejeonella sp.]|nr:nitrous oxide reductase accessory protein NosL [Daejeonella sp.]